jgi:hypothetical protein
VQFFIQFKISIFQTGNHHVIPFLGMMLLEYEAEFVLMPEIIDRQHVFLDLFSSVVFFDPLE